MSLEVSVIGRRYGEPNARVAEERRSSSQDGTHLIFKLEQCSSRSKESLRQHIEDEFKRWLNHLEWVGLISGSSSNETTGSPRSTSNVTQTGPNPWDSSQR